MNGRTSTTRIMIRWTTTVLLVLILIPCAIIVVLSDDASAAAASAATTATCTAHGSCPSNGREESPSSNPTWTMTTMTTTMTSSTSSQQQHQQRKSKKEMVVTIPPSCGMDSHKCHIASSLYHHGGTAQAYTPNAPISNMVCHPDVRQRFRYKIASWPLSRRSYSVGSAPILQITLKFWSCTNRESDNCCCTPWTMSPSSSIASSSSATLSTTTTSFKKERAVVHVWQPRPDGTYSSLGSNSYGTNGGGRRRRQRQQRPSSPHLKTDTCRARVPIQRDQGIATFTTVAPGSTGILGGIGPSGWDWNPYGPPTIHILVQVPGHVPLLYDLPILPHMPTLETRSFRMGDWRGAAWTRPPTSTSSSSSSRPTVVEPISWISNRINQTITAEYHVYLQSWSNNDEWMKKDRIPKQNDDTVDDDDEEDDDDDDDPDNSMCPSPVYGLPSSFFVEPISICAPFLLDYFAL